MRSKSCIYSSEERCVQLEVWGVQLGSEECTACVKIWHGARPLITGGGGRGRIPLAPIIPAM
jgi:uncharacterized protein (DUF2461 family)